MAHRRAAGCIPAAEARERRRAEKLTEKKCKRCALVKPRAEFPKTGRICRACWWSYEKERRGIKGRPPSKALRVWTLRPVREVRPREATSHRPVVLKAARYPPDIDGCRECRRCQKLKPFHKYRPLYTSVTPGLFRRVCTACISRKQGAKNPAKARNFQQRRLAIKRQGWVDPDSWQAVIEFYGGLCAYCRVAPWEQQDHVRALARGGQHTISNVVPACAACNSRKNCRTWEPSPRHPFMPALEAEVSA